ncbi:nucleoside triphosphate pyrophosphohydrolase [Aquisediminimonas sediminicola]|uniref:nucleoside triphosphate pyrophosphohydrolase n=1 Tax=Alteraquisediminimonas sediminicola TaxID=2676787 RepID=UPI001C8ED708|nr:nucleoside triphosphate pyrophosphohydrolase [Aquisediminimonas sediminicola]
MAEDTPSTPKSPILSETTSTPGFTSRADLLPHIEQQHGIDRLRAIMVALRDPTYGCPWDRVQSFSTIAPYTIEEAHEVADAIARDDMSDLCDELGDLLLQVVYHARIAEESDAFALDDVMMAICDKMIRRHPHVFGPDDAADTAPSPRWEQIKHEERANKGEDDSALAGVALGLPALLRAEKLQRRAARVGFDWPDIDGPRAKIVEELDEIEAAQSDEERIDEYGDMLFSMVNWGRHLGIDPESALRQANAKFERRFRRMEELAGREVFNAASLDEKEAYWVEAKKP